MTGEIHNTQPNPPKRQPSLHAVRGERGSDDPEKTA